MLAGMEWYDHTEGMVDRDAPCLAIAYENGRAQLMRDENDTKPILIDTFMSISAIQWNTNGSVIAFAGSQVRANIAPI